MISNKQLDLVTMRLCANKKWSDNIKMLYGLSSQQSLTIMLVNGSILKNEQLADYWRMFLSYVYPAI